MRPSPSLGRILPITIGQILAAPHPGGASNSSSSSSTVARGWVSSLRLQKNLAFIELNDGTAKKGLQVVVQGKKGSSELRAISDVLTRGASIQVEGAILPSPGPGQPVELRAASLQLLGACDETYPVPPETSRGERATLHLREVAHMRMRETENASVVRLRDQVTRGFRSFFEEHDFVHVHTPILTSSDCEGAGEVFSAISATSPPSDPFFRHPGANLTVSSQLHLELHLPSCPRVYTLAPAFRAEPSSTSRHLSEFWMLEAEVAFLTSVHQLMDVVEASVRSMAKHLTQSGASQGGAIWEQKHELTRQRLASLTETSSSSSWKRITYTQAVDILQAHWAAASADSSLPPPFYAPPPAWGQALGSSHEKWLAGVWAEGPLFVHDYPAAIKSFYMLPSNAAIEDGSGERRFVEESPDEAGERPTVACFDLLVPGMGELAGGSLREHRLESLLAVMQKRKMRLEPLDWYLDTRRYGSVPHGGYGMGFERLLCWISGVQDVRDVIGFPRWKGHCRF